MGCGASAAAGELRDARSQVCELEKKVAALEAEKGALLQNHPSAESATIPADAPGSLVDSGQTTKEEQKPLLENQATTPPEEAVAPVDTAAIAQKTAAERDLPSLQSSGDGAAQEKQQDEVAPPPGLAEASTDLSPEPDASFLPGTVNVGSDESTSEMRVAQDAPKSTPSMAEQGPTESMGEPSFAPPSASEMRVSVCHQCGVEGSDLYLDASDMNRYCEQCWSEYYGNPPNRGEAVGLVMVEVGELWPEERLARLWAENILPGWPPIMVHSTPAKPSDGEDWATIQVRVRRETVGPHAREQNNSEARPYPGEILAQRYGIKHLVGEGHFTKAYLAEDLRAGGLVCVKRHRNLSVEALADLLVLAKRIQEQDQGGMLFPHHMDSFYDIVGYTVESLIQGRNCLNISQSESHFFRSMRNLQHVASGALTGLMALDKAGVVHNDVKPDNLIWTEVCGHSSSSSAPCVKIVDFGCARLDMREEPPGRNWSLAEGGAGHLGKWSPEMALRLPITHKGDVWGVAISLCELHCGRFMWRNEADTAEVILAQAMGLCNLQRGLPSSLLRRSPLDVRQLYTPAPRHFPVRQNAIGQLEALRPCIWGLEQVLDDGFRENEKAGLGAFLERALQVDPVTRPSAAQLLPYAFFDGVSKVQKKAEEGKEDTPDDAPEGKPTATEAGTKAGGEIAVAGAEGEEAIDQNPGEEAQYSPA
mmetsp:Transcript_10064/g.22244  ORF Transcript_10064/g.22244 Transcript_10064/m.22244 type:complete len:705 (-) Transcript_10064:317-2431(-)